MGREITYKLRQLSMYICKIEEKYGMVYNIGTIMDVNFGYADNRRNSIGKLRNIR